MIKSLLFSITLLISIFFYNSISFAQAGYFIRDDCTTLSPVTFQTACLNTGSTGSLTQGWLYVRDDVDWVPVGTMGSSSSGLDSVMTVDNTTSHCTQDNPCQFGNGTVYVNLYCNDLNVCYIEMSSPGDTYLRARTNYHIILYDEELSAPILTIDPDASTQIGKYTFGSAYKPLATIYLDAGYFSSDGTQCATAAEATLNTNKPKVWSITCTDNDSGRITAKVTMPPKWDGGTIRMRPSWFSQDSVSTNIVQSWSGQCVRDGDAVADVATTGEQNATLTFQSEANEVQKAFTAAITLQGTCAGGATIFLTGDIDASGTTYTTMANARFLGAHLEYSVTSLSD